MRAAFVVALVGAALAPAMSAHAAVIAVNSAGDGADPTPTDTTCDDGAGHCTLRAAIQTANQGSPGADTITVPSGPITLSSSAGSPEDAAATGDLDIAHDAATASGQQDVTITGAGTGVTTVDANGIDRVFQVLANASATISGMTIKGGSTFAADSFGGGIASDGALTLDRVEVDDNTATFCGGVDEDDGTIAITNSTIDANTSNDGGGVCEDGGGTVTVADSTISGNQATGNGQIALGGGALEDGAGDITLTRTLVENNTANEGGGVSEDGGPPGGIHLIDSTVRGNHAVSASEVGRAKDVSLNGSGGGLSEDGDGSVTVLRSTVSGNDAAVNGGGFFGAGGAGGPDSGGSVVSFDNSTVDGNSSRAGGSGLFLRGFQFDANNPAFPEDVTLNNVTVNGNFLQNAASRQAGFGTPTQAAQIGMCDGSSPGDFCVGGTATLLDTIVSAGSPQNCHAEPGKGGISSSGHNIDSGTSCGLGAGGDQSSTDPKLGALAGNGGPTATDALLAGSPAIDKAGGCPPPTTDQRGVSRPQGAACDIGAYEVEQAAAPPGPAPAIVLPQALKPPCADVRKFTFRLHHSRHARIVRVKVFVNNKLRLTKHGRNLKKITIRQLPQHTFKVRVEALQDTGRGLVSRRTYTGCTKSRPHTARLHRHKRRHH